MQALLKTVGYYEALDDKDAAALRKLRDDDASGQIYEHFLGFGRFAEEWRDGLEPGHPSTWTYGNKKIVVIARSEPRRDPAATVVKMLKSSSTRSSTRSLTGSSTRSSTRS